MNGENTKSLPATSVPAVTEQQRVADEAWLQLKQLRSDSGDVLKQLMLAQQAKLHQMVQQLQPKSGKSEPDAEQRTDKEADTRASAGKVPLEDVVRLQQLNMGHLDLLIDRINASIETSLNLPGPD